MRIGVISRGKKNYSTRRLVKAANERGHRVTVMDPWDCALYIEAGRPRVTHRSRSVEGLKVIIPRLGSATAEYGLEVVAHFESVGVPSVNPATAVETARHKWRSLRALANAGLPTPPTFTAGNERDLDKAVNRIGGYPFIAKPFQGAQGDGIILFESSLTAKSALSTLWNLSRNYVAQRFYAEAAGTDIRALVIGDQVIGAIERIAPPDEFRANIHRGATGRLMRPSESLYDLAVRAAKAVGLGVAGVDLLRVGKSVYVLEANPSPGFEGFEKATGNDVAGLIIEFAVSLVEKR